MQTTMTCDANDLLQYFSLGQEDTETSPFLHTLNNFADIISLVPENISPCKYYDLNFQNNMLNPLQNLFLLHLNIRSLQKNYDKLSKLIDQLPTRPHLIGLSETKIKHQPLLDISLPNYYFIHAASPTNAGGVGLYIFDSLNYKLSTILDSYLKQPYDITLVGDFNINLDPEKCQTEAWRYLNTL